MKVLRAAFLAAALCMSAGAAAQAADPYVAEPAADGLGFYIRADAGWSFLDWSGGSDDDALALGAGVGYRFHENLRADLRYDWAGDYDIAPGADMSVSTVLGNLYYDIANDSSFTPYVGAGAGYGWTNVDGGGDDSGFAFALMGGVGVDLTENMVIDLGYRFRDVMVSGSDPSEHQALIGLRYEF